MRRLTAVLLVALAVVPAAVAGRIWTVGARMDGKTLNVKRGDMLTIALAANGTTGYSWSVKSYDKAVLTSLGTSYKAENGPPGHPGTYTLRMRARWRGVTTLRLVYRQAWDKKTPPAKTFTLRVFVR
jgi:inhibitor of cysteine peptidase